MGLERVRQKWTPVLSPDTRKNKRLESVWRFCHRQTDSKGRTLAVHPSRPVRCEDRGADAFARAERGPCSGRRQDWMYGDDATLTLSPEADRRRNAFGPACAGNPCAGVMPSAAIFKVPQPQGGAHATDQLKVWTVTLYSDTGRKPVQRTVLSANADAGFSQPGDHQRQPGPPPQRPAQATTPVKIC